MGAGFYLVGREDLPVQELCAQNGEPMRLQRGELGGKVAGGESRQACWSQARRALLAMAGNLDFPSAARIHGRV